MSGLRKKLSRLQSAGPGSKVSPERSAQAPEPLSSRVEHRSGVEQNETATLPSTVGSHSSTESGEDLSNFRSRMQHLGRGRSRRRKKKIVEVVNLPGEDWDSPYGTIRRVVTRYPLHHEHGQATVGAALEVSGASLECMSLDAVFANIPISGMLFLDTETTGLAGGSGTVPFLIGLAYFRDDAFVVEQLLLPKLGKEAPMLAYVAKRIEDASMLVSYNGKSYDMPLVKSRWVLSRVRSPELPPHLDLLHCARRIFGGMLEKARLVNIEESVLHFERVDDVPGALIPDIFFQFLKDGKGECLGPILEHNVYDLLALAAMMGVIHHTLQGPNAQTHPRVILAVAKLHMRHEDYPAALRWLSHLHGLVAPTPTLLDGYLLGARVLQKEKEWAQARDLLLEGLRATGCDTSVGVQVGEAHLMLAKLFEHKLRCYDLALLHSTHTQIVEGTDAWEKRQQRLARKLERCAEVETCVS